MASEPGCCPNRWRRAQVRRGRGCRVVQAPQTRDVTKAWCQPKGLGRPTAAGESPVGDGDAVAGTIPEYHGTREILWEAGGTTLQGE